MRRSDRNYSIFLRIFVPVLLLLIMQAVVLQVLMNAFGVYSDMTDNAYATLNERVEGRQNQLDGFLQSCIDLDSAEHYLKDLYKSYAADDASSHFFADAEAQQHYLLDASEQLISLLRRNKVNGIFIILQDERAAALPTAGGTVKRAGLSIRDYETDTTYLDKEDLLINRGSKFLIDKLKLVLDADYKSGYTLDASSEFFFNPVLAAQERPDGDYDDLAYFQWAHRVGDDDSDVDVTSYSVPLLASSGEAFGVLGIEITTNKLKELLPYRELSTKNKGAYALARVREDDTYAFCVTSGSYLSRAFNTDSITVAKALEKNCYEFAAATPTVCGSIAELEIYNGSAYYAGERTVLIGMTEQAELLAFGTQIQINMIISLVVSLAAGAVCLVLVIRRILAPIRRLYAKVRAADSPGELQFEKTKITEIDRLTESIEELNRKVNANKAKSEFFSRMSHDMRTPMNAIIGLSNAELTENATDGQKAAHLRQINESGKYLLGLINDILDINKLENEKIELVRRPVTLGEVWGMVVPIIGEIAAQKNIDFRHDLASIDEKLTVSVDVKRFSQIFINLLSNAVKFTDPGGTVELHVTVARKGDTVTQTAIVKDTGRGMSAEFQRVMFEQFTQENPEKEGTGLGLSIAKSLVELMGGSMTFRSELGSGTEFTVTVPCAVAENALPRDEPAAAAETDVPLKGKRLLICEDNEINAEIAGELLANRGAVCDYAENGSIGVSRFDASPLGYYDAILMDMRMPVMDGLAATQAIRSLPRADAKTVSIIAMTANAFDEDVNACLAAGMNAHIAKPIEPAVFYDVIVKELEKNEK